MLEKTVKDHVRKRLKELRAYYFFPVPFGLSATTVDILVCYKGRFIGIECKRPGEKPTTRQDFVMDEIRKAGGIVFVIDSKEKADDCLRADSINLLLHLTNDK